MKFLRALWLAVVRATRLCGRVTLLLVWLLLLGTLWLQLQVATLDRLEFPGFTAQMQLPGFARQWLEKFAEDSVRNGILASTGLRAEFGRARFDWTGRLVLDDVRLGVPAFSDPLVTARRVEARLDRWRLSIGEFDLHELRVSGAAIFTRLETNGSQENEALAQQLDFTLRPGNRILLLPYFFGRVGKVAITASGAVALPKTTSDRPLDFSKLISEYLQITRRVDREMRGLNLPDSLRLDVVLRPSTAAVGIAELRLFASGLDGPPLREWPALSSGPLLLATTLPLASDAPFLFVIEGAVDQPLVGENYRADALKFALRAEWHPDTARLSAQRLDVSAGFVSSRDPAVTLGPVALALLPHAEKNLSVSLSATVEGVPWDFAGDLDLENAIARVHTLLTLDNRLVAFADRLHPREPGRPLPRPLMSVVDFTAPARLDANADLKFRAGVVGLTRAEGWLTTGSARAEGVSLDEAGAHFIWEIESNRLVCDDAFLRVGESEARGSYEMDTSTLDYRFQLAGRLRPPAINTWMEDWWPEFWQRNFAFPGRPPSASLDLVGRWGEPLLTVIHIAVDAPGAAVRGVPFDTTRARLFIRPGWTDGLEVETTQAGGRGARGAFGLTINQDDESWRRLEFSGTTNLDLALVGPLIGPEAAEIVAPFRFDAPPQLVLSGAFEEQSPAGWARQSVDIAIESTGGLIYDGFPVRDLVAKARVRGDTIELPTLAVGFAGGRAEGSATLWTDAQRGRRVKFDGRLVGANLGEAIRTLENYSAARPGEPLAAESKLQQQLAAARLDLSLAAEGAFARPVRLHGAGRVKVTGADFGKIRLLGLLSSLLDRTLINFTSPRFDALGGKPAENRSVTDTAFAMDGETISFDDLWLTGPEAALMAAGAYRLDTQALDFRVQVLPFEKGKTLFARTINILTMPLSAALEVRLNGTLEQPEWIFVHGPTNLLRSLVGAKENPATPPTLEPEKK